MIKKLTAFLLICFPSLPAHAQTVTESHVLLDSVTVTAKRQASLMGITSDGTLKLNLKAMEQMPQILGNADPMRYARPDTGNTDQQ